MTPWLCTVPLGFCTRAWCILGKVVSRVPSGHGVSSRIFFSIQVERKQCASPLPGAMCVCIAPHKAFKEGGDADSVCLLAGHQVAY